MKKKIKIQIRFLNSIFLSFLFLIKKYPRKKLKIYIDVNNKQKNNRVIFFLCF